MTTRRNTSHARRAFMKAAAATLVLGNLPAKEPALRLVAPE